MSLSAWWAVYASLVLAVGFRTRLSLLRWTFTGAFFDHERLPWLTALFVIGLALAWLRRARPLERWVLLLFAATFALLLGRTTWGAAYSWIPFHGELEVIHGTIRAAELEIEAGRSYVGDGARRYRAVIESGGWIRTTLP